MPVAIRAKRLARSFLRAPMLWPTRAVADSSKGKAPKVAVLKGAALKRAIAEGEKEEEEIEKDKEPAKELA